MNRLPLALGLLAAAACAQRTLHPSYGQVYRASFGFQLADHQARPVAPMNGDEARRVVGSYYDSLGGSPGGGGASPTPVGGGGAGAPSIGNASFSVKGR